MHDGSRMRDGRLSKRCWPNFDLFCKKNYILFQTVAKLIFYVLAFEIKLIRNQSPDGPLGGPCVRKGLTVRHM